MIRSNSERERDRKNEQKCGNALIAVISGYLRKQNIQEIKSIQYDA